MMGNESSSREPHRHIWGWKTSNSREMWGLFVASHTFLWPSWSSTAASWTWSFQFAFSLSAPSCWVYTPRNAENSRCKQATDRWARTTTTPTLQPTQTWCRDLIWWWCGAFPYVVHSQPTPWISWQDDRCKIVNIKQNKVNILTPLPFWTTCSVSVSCSVSCSISVLLFIVFEQNKIEVKLWFFSLRWPHKDLLLWSFCSSSFSNGFL